MKKPILIKSLLVAATLPLFAGCVVRVRTAAPPPPPPPAVTVDMYTPPPAQVDVVPVAPGPADVWFWVPGAWEWRGHWVWAGGHWGMRPHPGAVWVASGWAWHGHHRVWVRGYWR
ncbi:MAG TPA: hypothetical protein VNU95_01950 [Candidatus Acidoferrales bacterium]|nr:hypothetical protein [Candidatus Acidoferrales bacterium]